MLIDEFEKSTGNSVHQDPSRHVMTMKTFSILLLTNLFFVCSLNAQERAAKRFFWEFTESRNNAENQFARIDGEKIELTSGAETDFFIEPGQPPYEKANAPLLLKTINNTKSFTFSVKTTPIHRVKYDAGMAFIYVNDKHWLKFAFEADERMNKRIVTVKTKDSSDDNNHDAVKSPGIYLKISSNTKAIGFYYSVDGKDWQLVRVFKNDYPPEIRIGIGSQSPVGRGNKVVFEDLQFSEQSVKDFRLGN